ncbi:MAG: glycerol-3-phosphate acyltransferase, partial [Oscillospiraceae bacterium]|nr:glycerol-3-phosphate acyltransferase [Oscillospiraceae bacterium]
MPKMPYLPTATGDFIVAYIGSAWWVFLLVAVVAYFCGCFNGAVIVSKYILRDDVRTHGSGNAGLTNFYRTFGGPLTAVVILTDVLKAVVAVWVGILAGRYLLADEYMVIALMKYWAGTFCLLG